MTSNRVAERDKPEVSSESKSIRVLLLADTHLGFDLPRHPRSKNRRRGLDFFANFDTALRPARQGEVDMVVHGGDLLYRSKVSAGLVRRALAPLIEVADRGVPVFLVPGNHERSRIPFPIFAAHSKIHIFDRARTFVVEKAGVKVAFSGFPFVPDVRSRFADLLETTGLDEARADVKLLCVHQAIEGVRVGPVDFTFRSGRDVIRAADIKGDLAAVLSGHIHRAQILEYDLAGRRLKAPVFYPGSVERTSFAERHEQKQYFVLRVSPDRASGGQVLDCVRHPLPTRPMHRIAIRRR